MVPIWLDQDGRPRETRPCPRCGREIAVLTVAPDHLKSFGWKPWQPWSVVEWCGHRIEGIPVSGVDGH